MPIETAQLRLGSDSVGMDAPILERQLLARVSELPGVRQIALGRNMEGSFGAGDYTLDLELADAPAMGLASALRGLAEVDSVVYRPIGGGQREPLLRDGVWRTLMFRVRPQASAQQVRALERDLLRMPDYMPGILNWRLARVLSADTWTHVWQQEFASVNDLLGEYLMHPFHWGWVDRWFDPECPDWTVEAISHAFCPLTTSLIASHTSKETYTS
ncbi:Dabb family protein [Cupriavidus sp. BIS7]|uniref:Dabb family protein n=1 Tax=Cupriavidus sp. BIS7 TaxID=1217718 RepID=UPI000376E009|nr:Dabb family protein [Cupriavidus sp. BIS7]